VAAEWLAGVVPVLQNGDLIGKVLQAEAIDETIDGRHVLGFENGQDRPHYLGPLLSRGQRAVGGEIVEGESYLGCLGLCKGEYGVADEDDKR
jgi:hypothetical protein